MQLYPNIITSGNLLCGLLSISFSIMDKPFLAAYLIFLGMIFDFLDGKIARYINLTSNVGTYLDSLADFISFGIAPVVFVYELTPLEFKRIIFYCVLAYLVCGFLRLIRYTFSQKKKISGVFSGLPIPAAAGTLLSFFLVYLETNMSFPLLPSAFIIILISFLMISTRPYQHFAKVLSEMPILLKSIIIVIMILSLVNRCQDLFLLTGFLLYLIMGIAWKRQYDLKAIT